MKFLNELIKWLLVLIIGLSAALLAIIFLSGSEEINQFLLRLVVLIVIGFFGGLAGRVLFPKTQVFLTLAMVTIASLICVLLIDLFYETPYQFDFIEANFNTSEFSISDGSQIGLMILAALLPVLMIRHGVKNSTPAARKPKSNRIPLSSRMNSFFRQVDPRNWQIFKPMPKQKKRVSKPSAAKKIQAKPKTAAKTKVNKPASSTSTLTVSRPANKVKSVTKIHSGNGHKPAKVKPATRKLKMPAKFLGRNGNDVRLVGEEEHVCPYCLDEVVKGDERGTVVCPECGTWHHQDCWNLTGACGVAHRNEL
jgi:ribosomal protein L37AE/L43A/glucan phosphoethanolaminetransferase (alkaline phosphatase superfamily)